MSGNQSKQEEEDNNNNKSEEEFNLQLFRAKLERNVEVSTSHHVVVNLDEYFKQQRIKKLMDVQKKNEAATFLQSYKHVDLTVAKPSHGRKSVSPVKDVEEMGVVALGSKEDEENVYAQLDSTAEKDNQKIYAIMEEKQSMERNKSCNDHGKCFDIGDNHVGSIEQGICDKNMSSEETIDADADTDYNQEEKHRKKKHQQYIHDMSLIPSDKHLLVPPERNYKKLFQSCWCRPEAIQ